MAKSADLSGLAQLQQRLLFVLGAILVYRLGAHVPVPGIDPVRLAEFFHQQQNTILSFFNMFSGGAMQRLTVFALGIMPYISASIVIQLLTVVSPTLEQLKKEGESGRRKISQYTRYFTLALAAFQSIGMSRYLVTQGIAMHAHLSFYLVTMLTLTTGTLFLMWLGEQITERGIGNGISIIIFAGIAAGLPSALGRTLEQVREGQLMLLGLILLLAAVVLITALVVFIEKGQRRITVHYARRQQGRKIMGGQSTHLPFKVNMAGVIPPIFASSIILFPATLAQWFGHSGSMVWLSNLGLALSPGRPLYVVCFAICVVFFCFFYTALVFNPRETSDNLKKAGAFVPGIRPGEQTARYIDGVMTRLTVAGSIYLVGVSLLPELFVLGWNVPFYFGGTSLLIVVVVVMDFMAQVQTHLMSHQYPTLMQKSKIIGRQ